MAVTKYKDDMSKQEIIRIIREHMETNKLYEPQSVLITYALSLAMDALMNSEPRFTELYIGRVTVSELIEAALAAIRDALDLAMWNINQTEYITPFGNSSETFYSDVFSVQAYNWEYDDNPKGEQPYNFKWKDYTVYWYKYFGRGMEANRNLSYVEIEQMLHDCLEYIHTIEDSNGETW